MFPIKNGDVIPAIAKIVYQRVKLQHVLTYLKWKQAMETA